MHDYPRTFLSADGLTGRLHLPGGVVRPGAWAGLADLAELGDAKLHVTSRGNLQVRGIRDGAAFRELAAAAGIYVGPSIIASPLARLDSLIDALSTRLAATTASSRVLVGIDDGSGDVLAQAPDLGLQLTPGGARLIQAGELVGEDTAVESALAEITRLAPTVSPVPATRVQAGAPEHPPVGWLPADDGTVALGAGLRLGVIEARVARMLDVIGVAVTVTPGRTLVIHDLSESVAEQVVRVLAPLGLIFDANSPWLRISACIGAPACAQAVSDVRADAGQAADAGMPGRLHFAGCARGCGRPRHGHTLYQATGDGEYEVLEPNA